MENIIYSENNGDNDSMPSLIEVDDNNNQNNGDNDSIPLSIEVDDNNIHDNQNNIHKVNLKQNTTNVYTNNCKIFEIPNICELFGQNINKIWKSFEFDLNTRTTEINIDIDIICDQIKCDFIIEAYAVFDNLNCNIESFKFYNCYKQLINHVRNDLIETTIVHNKKIIDFGFNLDSKFRYYNNYI